MLVSRIPSESQHHFASHAQTHISQGQYDSVLHTRVCNDKAVSVCVHCTELERRAGPSARLVSRPTGHQ